MKGGYYSTNRALVNESSLEAGERFVRRHNLVDAATGWPPARWGTSPVGAPLGFA